MPTIQHIPDEILSLIFEIGMDDNFVPNFLLGDHIWQSKPLGVRKEKQPFVVLDVCKQWRDVYNSIPPTSVTTLIFPSDIISGPNGSKIQQYTSTHDDIDATFRSLFDSRIKLGGVLSDGYCDVDIGLDLGAIYPAQIRDHLLD